MDVRKNPPDPRRTDILNEAELPQDVWTQLAQAVEQTGIDPVLRLLVSEAQSQHDALRGVTAAIATRYRALIDAVPDAITIHDADGRLRDANEAACRLYRRERAELLLCSIHDLTPDLDPDFISLLNAAFDRGDTLRFESTLAPLSVSHQGGSAASTISFALPEGRSLSEATEAIDAVTKSWAGLAGLLLLFLLIAQFIAYFNYTKMPQVAAVKLGDLIENVNVPTIVLLLVAIVIVWVVGIIMPQAIAKWALLAPIFIPVFVRLGVDPAAVLAAYRVGDSPLNVVNPIMAYFPLIVVFAARYDKRSGIGTVIALMMPYFLVLTVVWTVFFLLWYAVGLPWGV